LPLLKIHNKHWFYIVIGFFYLVTACKSYKQDILFKLDDSFVPIQIESLVQAAESNYLIRQNDFLNIEVYTNKGEIIIDPNNELLTNKSANLRENRYIPDYLVTNDGYVKLPIVGAVKLEGLTLREAETLLEEEYSEYYKDAYVLVSYTNKRVTVLGAPGGLVIPLENENVNLLEVIALAGGVPKNAKGQNIRLIRGDLNDPEVFLIDLSTVEGMKSSLIPVEAGDVIYIEPVRRPVTESVRDLAPVIAVITSTITLIILIFQIN